MRYLNKRMLLAIHSMCLQITGGYGQGGDLRVGQSLSFVENIFHNEIFGQEIYPDMYHQAAAYMFHIIKSHTFHDGNKRTGLAAAITFLELNGQLCAALPEQPVFEFVIDIAGGPNDPETQIPRIAAWLETLARQGEAAR